MQKTVYNQERILTGVFLGPFGTLERYVISFLAGSYRTVPDDHAIPNPVPRRRICVEFDAWIFTKHHLWRFIACVGNHRCVDAESMPDGDVCVNKNAPCVYAGSKTYYYLFWARFFVSGCSLYSVCVMMNCITP